MLKLIETEKFEEKIQQFFDLWKLVFCDGTDTHTHGHGDSRTKSAQLADSVKISILLL